MPAKKVRQKAKEKRVKFLAPAGWNDHLYLIPGPPGKRSGPGNFYKQVGKGWRARPGIWVDARNMVAGTQLAEKRTGEMMPLPLDRNSGRIAWHQIGSPVRIIAILRATLKARVPVGYEDEAGFHYGAEAAGWFFSI
jgi:hypothetical protein